MIVFDAKGPPSIFMARSLSFTLGEASFHAVSCPMERPVLRDVSDQHPAGM